MRIVLFLALVCLAMSVKAEDPKANLNLRLNPSQPQNQSPPTTMLNILDHRHLKLKLPRIQQMLLGRSQFQRFSHWRQWPSLSYNSVNSNWIAKSTLDQSELNFKLSYKIGVSLIYLAELQVNGNNMRVKVCQWTSNQNYARHDIKYVDSK